MSVIPPGLIAFALICSGSFSHARIGPSAHRGLSDYVTRRETHELQIDLAADRWCIDRCETTERIGKFTPDWIGLSGIETPQSMRAISINRRNGAFYSSTREGSRSSEAQVVCHVSAFRGFSARKR